jgi:hypothetical protein
MAAPVFVYLDFGHRKLAHLQDGEHGIELEMQYSISTLRADSSAPCRIVIYTDHPERYAELDVEIVDIRSIDEPYFGDRGYVLRLKPCVLLHALHRYGGVCVFLDSDMFFYPGFTAAVSSMIEEGAIFWEFHDRPPVSAFPADLSAFPHRALHNPSREFRADGNSGVVGLRSGWGEPLLEDVLWLIDEMRARGDRNSLLEQSSFFEAAWLHGRIALDAMAWGNHYCTRSKKRYMHWRIKKLIEKHGRPLPPAEPSIPLTMTRVKLYQYYWDVKRTALGLPRH